MISASGVFIANKEYAIISASGALLQIKNVHHICLRCFTTNKECAIIFASGVFIANKECAITSAGSSLFIANIECAIISTDDVFIAHKCLQQDNAACLICDMPKNYFSSSGRVHFFSVTTLI